MLEYIKLSRFYLQKHVIHVILELFTVPNSDPKPIKVMGRPSNTVARELLSACLGRGWRPYATPHAGIDGNRVSELAAVETSTI